LLPTSGAIELALRPANIFWTIFVLNASEYFMPIPIAPHLGC
jgi:hypothetical protein